MTRDQARDTAREILEIIPLVMRTVAAELRAAGNSLAQIAATLDAEGVPTPSGRGQWRKSSVRHVLARWDQENSATDSP